MAAISHYIAAISDRDPDLMCELDRFFRANGVVTIAFDPDQGLDEQLLAERCCRVVMPKLMTAQRNRTLFRQLRRTKLRFLNSLQAVERCQSRRAMFRHLRTHLSECAVPEMYEDAAEAARALARGTEIWVRRDAHNIPKEERVVGIVASTAQLERMVERYPPYTLFFQEYFGVKQEVLKLYIIGERVFGLKKIGAQDGVDRSGMLETERFAVPEPLQTVARRVGAAFDMAVYGVDILTHGGRDHIVDVNDFPSFRGIEEAPEAIYRYIARRYLHGAGMRH